jgi:hypothetical protein
MAQKKHRYWSDQIDALVRELSILSVACGIDPLQKGIGRKILENDTSICSRDNPEAFRKMRQHLMAFFPLEKRALDRIGAEDTQEILHEVEAAFRALHASGRPDPNQADSDT